MRNKYLNSVLVFLAFLLGIGLARWYFQKSEPQTTESATVLLEKIKSVAKLTTVEGYFSEIYDYKDFYYYDVSIFRKKALLRVKAKVSIGYDLEKMKIETRPGEKIILISPLPEPSILSIDHEIDYYDIQEGSFNAFSPEDLTKLNKNAKDFIEQKVLDSDLMQTSKSKTEASFDAIKIMVEAAGWEVKTLPSIPRLIQKTD